MRNIWTILGVIAAIVIAWFIVNALFSVLAFVFKALIVLVVAAIVYGAIRAATSRSSTN